MAESPYAPPEAAVETQDVGSGQEYFVVSITKLVVLTILTLNLYLVYWFYRNWRIIKIRLEDDIWPPMRGLFYIFFTHSLFGLVNDTLKEKGKDFNWSPSGAATIVVVITLFNNLSDRVLPRVMDEAVAAAVGVLVFFLLPISMIKPQRAINAACDDENGSANANFTVWNWLWMIAGGLLWLVIVLGVVVMFTDPELLVE